MRLLNVIFFLFLFVNIFHIQAQEEKTDEPEKKEDVIIMDEESMDDDGSDFFDFNEGDGLDGEDLFSTTNTEEKKTKEKKERAKPSRTHTTYFHRPGNMVMKFGSFYMNTPRSTSPPISAGLSMTLFRNFELGVYLIYFNFREYIHMDTVQNATAWSLDQPKIGHLMFSAKGTYHFGEYIKMAMPVFEVEDNRLIYGAGTRYIYNDFFSLFIEGVSGDYGVFNFGVDIKVSDLRF